VKRNKKNMSRISPPTVGQERQIPMSESHWIGVDLGGTKILAGLLDSSMKIQARSKEPTPQPGQGPAAVFERIGRAVDRVLKEANVAPDQVRGLGLGVPGQIDPTALRVKFAPNLDWHDVDLRGFLPSSWPWKPLMGKAARAGPFGGWKRGAARGPRHVLGVFAGTGVGGALILDGKLYHGFNFNAGEIGHIVINWRKGTTLETVAGRRNMMRRWAADLADAPKGGPKGRRGGGAARDRRGARAEYYPRPH